MYIFLFVCPSAPLSAPCSRPFHIISELNQKAVDIQARSPAADAKVLLWAHDPAPGAKNQLWYQDSEGFIRSSLNDFVFSNKGLSVR